MPLPLASEVTRALASFYPEPPVTLRIPGDHPWESLQTWLVDIDGKLAWHFVTQELAVPGPARYELSLRVLAGRERDRPPAWAIAVLHEIGVWVREIGKPLPVGFPVPVFAPWDADFATELVSSVLVNDPELETIKTASASVGFRQVCPMTALETTEMNVRSIGDVLTEVRAADPLCVVDLARPSLFEDRRAALVAVSAQKPLQMPAVVADALSFEVSGLLRKRLAVRLGASSLAALQLGLGRVLAGKEFTLIGRGGMLTFRLSETPGFTAEGSKAQIELPAGAVGQFMGLPPRHGLYELAGLPRVEFDVRQTRLNRPDGGLARLVG